MELFNIFKKEKYRNPNVWIVLFSKRHSADFWTLFTWHRKNFDHCFCMRYDKWAGSWILLDWSSYGLIVEYISHQDAVKLMADNATIGGKVLKIRTEGFRSSPLLPAFFCVSVVKHVLGIRCFAITPYQLYCALRKRGAVEIF